MPLVGEPLIGFLRDTVQRRVSLARIIAHFDVVEQIRPLGMCCRSKAGFVVSTSARAELACPAPSLLSIPFSSQTQERKATSV